MQSVRNQLLPIHASTCIESGQPNQTTVVRVQHNAHGLQQQQTITNCTSNNDRRSACSQSLRLYN